MFVTLAPRLATSFAITIGTVAGGVLALMQAQDVGVEDEHGHGSAALGGKLLGLAGVAIRLHGSEPVVE